jgi:hypothetical protein
LSPLMRPSMPDRQLWPRWNQRYCICDAFR